jgi:multidrug efflux pump subunit AcrB
MNAFAKLLGQTRLVLTSAVLLSLLGALAWIVMPRQEDPAMERRFGLVTVAFPGADAETVERLVVEPLEEELAQVDALKRVDSRSRAAFAVVNVEFRDDTDDFDDAWERVEEAVARAQPRFPAGVLDPAIDRDTIDQDSVVVAITGSGDPLVLAEAARRLERALLRISDVSAVHLVADPGEQITIEYDETTAAKLGIDPGSLAAALQARNVTPAGGAVRLGKRVASLRPSSEFRTVEEIERTPILLPTGASVPLAQIATVRHGPDEPATERMRVDGEPAIGLGIVARDGIDLVAYGEHVRAEVERMRGELAPLRIVEVTYQPEHVEARIADLGQSLLVGVGIVAVVLLVAMGPRLGLVVAAVVPLVALSSVAIYAAGGGILHQISIAALVIALGMLVDNAIVVAESIQTRVDAGETPTQAAIASVRQLLVPLGTATGTTVAAFVPMYLAEGGTADFTRAIPVVIVLTLGVSYVFAVLVTPALSRAFLRPQPQRSTSLFERLAGWLGRVAVARHRLVLAVALVGVVASIAAAGKIEQRFFPESDRPLVIVDLALPEGSHIDEIDAVAHGLERALRDRPEVAHVASFVGRAAPHFYYNLLAKPSSPHLAQLVIVTHSKADNATLVDWVREQRSTALLAGIEVVARPLEQGPPIAAPVEVRITGEDLVDLRRAADLVVAELSAVEGAADVRDDLSLGVPTVAFEIDDAAAARRGLARADIARALLGRTRGLEVGQFRAGDDPVPIYVRAPEGDETTLDSLHTLPVAVRGRDPTPMGQLAHPDVRWRPAAIRHRDRERIVSVLAQVEHGVATSQVIRALQARLDSVELPTGVELHYGGEAEGSAEANTAMLKTVPLGVLLLLVFLMAEFNSFRRVTIIMSTVPLALIGVVPGLIFSAQPFGFMALLGVIALVGVVVNNAIVLLDLVESERARGVAIGPALAEAVRVRTRPILLTSGTTVAGLMPLALSDTTLWPPLAWTMISGLGASTLLTLLVVPALYRVLFRGA